jgi:diaminopimelate decarboxylase
MIDKIDGISVEYLVSQYGTPLYVVSENTLRKRVREFRDAFEKRSTPTIVAYSYKTNYLSAICAIIHQEGAWAEVVSGFEYDIARSLGVDGGNIIFNGPYKRDEELALALENKSLINVDSLDEINRIAKIGFERRRKVPIGIRVNAHLGYTIDREYKMQWSRFGFNLESGEAFDAFKYASNLSSLEIRGIQIHMGTNMPDTGVYAQAAALMLDFIQTLGEKLGLSIKYLDLGGGFACQDTPFSLVIPDDWVVPPFDDYAGAICSILRERNLGKDNNLTLILEPGRALVAESVFLLTRIVAKKVQSDTVSLVVDAGINLLPEAYYLKHKIEPIQNSDRRIMPIDIYGPLCMQVDQLGLGVEIPEPEVGDILVVRSVGAYNISHSIQFIQPRPGIVLVHDGVSEYIKLPENYSEIRRLERIPQHLIRDNRK